MDEIGKAAQLALWLAFFAWLLSPGVSWYVTGGAVIALIVWAAARSQ